MYGLTKGQAGPTSGLGFVARNVPSGTLVPPFNPLAAALAADATFVARGFAGDIRQLGRLVAEAVKHKGFGFVDIQQPCVTYNKVNTFAWYKDRVYDLAQDGHNPTNASQAWQRAREWPGGDGKRIPVGVFYRAERPVYEAAMPALKPGPLVERPPEPAAWRRMREEFR